MLQGNRMKPAPVRTIHDTAKKIDTLIFDLFGVLISFDEDIVCGRLAPHCADPEAELLALRGLVSQRDLITWRQSLDQLHQQLVAAHGLAMNRRGFEAAWLQPYSEPMPGMADLIRSLSRRYKLALLSNVDKYYWQVVHNTHPAIACFDTLLLSWEFGLAKPDPEVFVHALKAQPAATPRGVSSSMTRARTWKLRASSASADTGSWMSNDQGRRSQSWNPCEPGLAR